MRIDSLPRLTLVLGGARSGKSRHAEQRIEAVGGGWYVATAQAFDAEMTDRIAHHRARRGQVWQTLEEPLDLPGALDRLAGQDRPVLVDCLTLWVSNLLLADRDVAAAQTDLLVALARLPVPAVLIANETGLGIVPDHALARRFRDAAGLLNQAVAARAEQVEFLIAGLPMRVKG